MASTPKLNETQFAVLRWIADGSPVGHDGGLRAPDFCRGFKKIAT